jgi:hypothetical protein
MVYFNLLCTPGNSWKSLGNQRSLFGLCRVILYLPAFQLNQRRTVAQNSSQLPKVAGEGKPLSAACDD